MKTARLSTDVISSTEYWAETLQVNIALATGKTITEHSGVGKFSSKEANWDTYLERMENFFVAHNITNAGKK